MLTRNEFFDEFFDGFFDEFIDEFIDEFLQFFQRNMLIFLGAVNMITKHFGSVAASTMKNMDMERLPLLVLIYKLRGSTEIFQVSNLSFDDTFKVSEQRG